MEISPCAIEIHALDKAGRGGDEGCNPLVHPGHSSFIKLSILTLSLYPLSPIDPDMIVNPHPHHERTWDGPAGLHKDLILKTGLEFLVGQDNAIPDDGFISDGDLVTEDGATLNLDTIIGDLGVVGGGRGTLDPTPPTHPGVPTDDAVEDTGIATDLDIVEDDGLAHPNTPTNDDTGTDGDIGPDLRRGVDHGGGVDDDGTDDLGAPFIPRGTKEVLGGLGVELEVEGIGGDGGTSGLDLPPGICGLKGKDTLVPSQGPEDILLQAKDIRGTRAPGARGIIEGEFLLHFILEDGGDRGVTTTLEGLGNLGKDGDIKEVDTTGDEVGDEALGLLDIVKDLVGSGVLDQTAKVVCGFPGHLGGEDGAPALVIPVEASHGGEGEGAGYVGMKDKESIWGGSEDLIAKVVNTTGSTKGCEFT